MNGLKFNTEQHGELKEVRGLLTKFINEKARGYVEPTRKGTPRGEPIGFSKKKYLATLLSMTSLDLKKQAVTIGVSYGLLRKWRSEGRFIDLQDTIIAEYVGLFEKEILNSLKKQYYKDKRDEANYPKDTLERFKQIEKEVIARRSKIKSFEDEIKYYGTDLLGDFGIYGKILISEVMRILNIRVMKGLETEDELQTWLGAGASGIASKIFKYLEPDEWRQLRKNTLRKHIDDLLNDLSVDRIPNRKRKILVYLLKKILENLEI